MRERWIDEARGYALLLVVLGHMGISYFGQYFTTCHLPLFYFLSGYLFSTRDAFPVFVKRKVKRLLVPYFCFGIILIISSVIQGRGLSDLLAKFAFQERMYTIWFLTSLFFVNIVFYWITQLVKNRLWAILGIALAMYVGGVLYYRNHGTPLFWNIDTVLIATIWFSAGYALRTSGFMSKFTSDERKTRKAVVTAAASGLLYIGLVCVNWAFCHEKFDIALRTVGLAPLTLFASFAGIVLFVSVSQLFRIAYVNYLGKNTMVYFALHQSVMLPLIGCLYASLGLFTQETMLSDLTRLLLSVTLILACLYPIDRLLNKTKLRFMLGM